MICVVIKTCQMAYCHGQPVKDGQRDMTPRYREGFVEWGWEQVGTVQKSKVFICPSDSFECRTVRDSVWWDFIPVEHFGERSGEWRESSVKMV